jgi:hypothetical protein
MTGHRWWLWVHLTVALAVEFVFLAFILPACARDSAYETEVWKDFGVASGAVVVIYLIWPALRWGGIWLRLGGLMLCFLPAWTIAWVLLQHFELVPRWFS